MSTVFVILSMTKVDQLVSAFFTWFCATGIMTHQMHSNVQLHPVPPMSGSVHYL